MLSPGSNVHRISRHIHHPVSLFFRRTPRSSLEASWRGRDDEARKTEREGELPDLDAGCRRRWPRIATLGGPGDPTILAVRSRVYKKMDIGVEWERERERERGILKYRMEYVNGGWEGFFDSRWDHRVLSGDIYMAPWILLPNPAGCPDPLRGLSSKLYTINLRAHVCKYQDENFEK